MIHSFEIKDPEKTHVEWLPKVPALAKPREFEFKPGLNILWGKNGSGKSTVLKAMARLLHCEQGGVPVVTTTSLATLFQRRNDPSLDRDSSVKTLTKAVRLNHDGQAVRYFDPSVAVGLMGGGSAFDDDFFSLGVINTVFKGSAGQTTMFRFDKLASDILQGEVPQIGRKDASQVNDLWGKRIQAAEEFLKGSGERGQPTILLDEPERSYDLPHQVGIWRFIRAMSSKIQFIVASHSFYALRIPEAHYIELEPDYLATSLKCLTLLTGWSEEKPVASSYEKIAEKSAPKKPVKARKKST